MASGSQKRFTTVHDRAALRVHPDGARVTAKESRYATEDVQGNRTAVNAGGVGSVRKRRRVTSSDDGTEPPEEFDIETDDYQPSDSQHSSTDSRAEEVEDETEGESGRRKRRKKDQRTTKRTQFYQDFDFILGGKRGAEITPVYNGPLLPSSVSGVFRQMQCSAENLTEQDLLKCLHNFAAEYYSERGQLIDASRIARQKKRAKMNADHGSRSGSHSTVGSISCEESDTGSADISPTLSTIPRAARQKGRQGADHVKDMYKMLDGSALVALGRPPQILQTLSRRFIVGTGIFVHEHIERLVRRDWVLGFERDPNHEESTESDRKDEDGD